MHDDEQENKLEDIKAHAAVIYDRYPDAQADVDWSWMKEQVHQLVQELDEYEREVEKPELDG